MLSKKAKMILQKVILACYKVDDGRKRLEVTVVLPK